LLIPTLDSVRYEWLLDAIVTKMGKPMLCIGGVGVTKTATVMQYASKFDPDKTATKVVPFSSATTPLIFQRTIEGSVEKRQGKYFGPPGGKKMLVFIDDCSMPEINEWNDQITNEVTRQVLSEEGIYNLDKPGEWKAFVDLMYVGAMTHPCGGKNDIPNRLKRQFCVINITMPTLSSIDGIYGSIMRGRFCKPHFQESLIKVADKLTDATISVWQRMTVKIFLLLPNSTICSTCVICLALFRASCKLLVTPSHPSNTCSVFGSTNASVSLWINSPMMLTKSGPMT